MGNAKMFDKSIDQEYIQDEENRKKAISKINCN